MTSQTPEAPSQSENSPSNNSETQTSSPTSDAPSTPAELRRESDLNVDVTDDSHTRAELLSTGVSALTVATYIGLVAAQSIGYVDGGLPLHFIAFTSAVFTYVLGAKAMSKSATVVKRGLENSP